jgi:hypothetical protein
MELHLTSLVYGTFAYLVFLGVQVPLTVLLAVTSHKAAGLAGSLLLYAIVWPCVGFSCGFCMELIAIGFGIATSISQLTDVLDKNVTAANLILAILAFLSSAATLVLIMPCTTALNECMKEINREAQFYAAAREEARRSIRFVPPPPRPSVSLAPPPRALTIPTSPHWVTVISPDNHIDIATK